MPCRDPDPGQMAMNENREYARYLEDARKQLQQNAEAMARLMEENVSLKQKVQLARDYEAAFCALMHNLDHTIDTEYFLDCAEQNGRIDIRLLWEQHQAHDETRLRNDLAGYSEDEKALLRKILNEGQ